MAGRRFVDAAKLFQASKSIASKHITLRSQQFDTYQKTSTLAKAIKSQTDRVTLTAAAAIALYKRSNEGPPTYTKTASEHTTDTQHTDIPRRETVERHDPIRDIREGFSQDHHYDYSGQTTTAQPPPELELDIEQAKAPRHPLPDGTIPSAGVTLSQEERGQDTFSGRSVSEAPKDPLAKEQGTRVRQENEGIRPIESTESTIPLPKQPRSFESKATEPIPAHANDLQPSTETPKIHSLLEGHDRDVFYTRSVESQPTSSAQSFSQIPKEAADKQGSNSHVEDGRLNQDVFYATPKPGQEPVQTAIPEFNDIPEGVNTDVFHSKRVARMLGQDRYSRKEHLGSFASKGTGRHPLDDRPVVQPEQNSNIQPGQTAQQHTPVQATGTNHPSSMEQQTRSLASKLINDAEGRTTITSEVRTGITFSKIYRSTDS